MIGCRDSDEGVDANGNGTEIPHVRRSSKHQKRDRAFSVIGTAPDERPMNEPMNERRTERRRKDDRTNDRPTTDQRPEEGEHPLFCRSISLGSLCSTGPFHESLVNTTMCDRGGGTIPVHVLALLPQPYAVQPFRRHLNDLATSAHQYVGEGVVQHQPFSAAQCTTPTANTVVYAAFFLRLLARTSGAGPPPRRRDSTAASQVHRNLRHHHHRQASLALVARCQRKNRSNADDTQPPAVRWRSSTGARRIVRATLCGA